MSLVLRYAARSDRGLVRTNNEDSVYAGARLLALADGMGGHAAGEVASQLVIGALAHLDYDEPGGDLLTSLEAAVYDGNAAIAAQVEMEPNLEGMGTTLTAILFAGDRLGLVHIGDSRGYLLRDGELTQITKDDTFVQTLVDDGRITAEEAHCHPQRSLIMRALTGHEVEPTLTIREARAGDRYLLCSDGLSDPVRDETILEALQIPDVSDSAYRLIELALRGGGPDNVTVVVADVVDDEYGQTEPILAGAVSGEEDQNTVPPNTAAGRASALRQRQITPKRTVQEAEPPPRKRMSRQRILLIATFTILLLLAAVAIASSLIGGTYYVAETDGEVTIMQGLRGSLLGVTMHHPEYVGCLDGSTRPYRTRDASNGCHTLKVSDLNESKREWLRQGQSPSDSLNSANQQLRELTSPASLLPICVHAIDAATTAPPPAPKSQPAAGPSAACRSST